MNKLPGKERSGKKAEMKRKKNTAKVAKKTTKVPDKHKGRDRV